MLKSESGGHNNVSKENIPSIYLKYESGITTEELACEYGISAMTIHEYLKKADINTRKRGDHIRIFSSYDQKQICDSYEKGASSAEISNKYKCNPNSIIQILKKYGIRRRDTKGENNPNWKDGRSFEPYCHKFNENFKERCRKYLKRKCGICGLSESENIIKWGQKLSVHHVNYNKDALCKDGSNLFIPLCRKCHSKTNTNRRWWEIYLTNYLMIWFNGETY